MRSLVFALVGACSQAVFAGERCIAIDGDTLVCDHQKVRLTNVYAAELNEPGGHAAKRRLQALVTSADVRLRPLGQDRYGRTLAEVYVNGRRIEQVDIGPRAGRGAQWHGERHPLQPHSKSPNGATSRTHRGALKKIPGNLAIFCAFVGPGRPKSCGATTMTCSSILTLPPQKNHAILRAHARVCRAEDKNPQ